MRRLAVVVVVSAGLLAGCAREEPAPAPFPSPQPRPSAAQPPGAAGYVETAASIDLFSIRASEMALARSTDSRIRAAAQAMLADHRGTSGQLSFAGRRLNLLPDASMLPLHRRMLDELTLAVNFDRAWRERMSSVHRNAVELHGAYAARGKSPTLRPVAAAALPIERRHVEQLRGIR